MKRFIVLILMGTMLVTGCTGSTESVKTSSEAQANVPQQSQEIYLMAGKIEAQSEVNVASKISARVAKVTPDVGTVVHKDDPLIYLEITDINAGVKQAEAAVSTAQANLNKALRGARSEQLAQYKAALEAASKSYETAQRNVDRIRQLYQAGGATAQQMESAESALVTAQATLRSAQEQYNMASSGETKESISILQAQVNQAKAGLEAARAQQSNGIIVAPVSGTISARSIDPGEMASPGNTLLSIVSDEGTYINAQAPTDVLSYLKDNMPVTVRVREYPDKKFSGEITVISPVVDQKTKTVQVKVRLTQSAPELKSGMIAEVGIKYRGEGK